jgi:hypothetical protein
VENRKCYLYPEKFQPLALEILNSEKSMLHTQTISSISRKLILSVLFVLGSLISSADWKGYFDHSDIIALVKCTKTSENSEKITVLKCYKGNLKKGDELTLTTYFRDIVGVFGRTNLVIFADIKADSSIEKSYNINHWLQLQGKSIESNLYDRSPTPYTSITQFKNFDRFLDAYGDSTLRPEVYKEILKKLKRAKHVGEVTLYLMELYILGFNQYHPIFGDFTNVNNSSLQYALIHLMGNIRTDESRAILNSFLSSKKMWLVGMTIQILANDAPEKAGPILLERYKIWNKEELEYKSWDNQVYVGSNSDFGVFQPFISIFQNSPNIEQEEYQSSMGRWEIIAAFGKLRYEPAGPFLISLLDKCNPTEYLEIVDALQKIGNKEYVHHLNMQLDSSNHDNVYWLSRKIAKDSIIECLPSLRNYVSRINRNEKCYFHFLVSDDEGLGAFSDSLTRDFLLLDFENFLDSSRTLLCDEITDWNVEYIKSFSKNKESRALPLLNRALFETYALNEDFGKYPKLFQIKKELEDSAMIMFQQKLQNTGYKWFSLRKCVAFIDNTKEVAQGKSPKAHFAVECEVIEKERSFDSEGAAALYAEIIQKELGIVADSVSIRIRGYNYTKYELPSYNWIVPNDWHKPLFYEYSNYFIENPTEEVIQMYQGLLDYNYIKRPREIEALNNTILEMKTKLTELQKEEGQIGTKKD